MNRRRFLQGGAAVLLAAPLAAGCSRRGKVARLGLLGLFTPELGSRSVAAVRNGLGDLGWHEGQNMHFEHRYASGKRDQLAALAAELVQQKVDVIVAFGTDATRAARGVTSSIFGDLGLVWDQPPDRLSKVLTSAGLHTARAEQIVTDRRELMETARRDLTAWLGRAPT